MGLYSALHWFRSELYWFRMEQKSPFVQSTPTRKLDRKRIVLLPGRWAKFDPFLMMAEDWFTEPGFDWHPHRGIETVTFVLAGRQRHQDSSGAMSVLEPGDAQWMTAGRGIIHQELAEGRQQMHSLQLWVNLPAPRKLTAPGAQNLRRTSLPSGVNGGVRVTTYARPGAATTVNSPMSLFHVEFEQAEGTLDVGGTALPEGKVGLSHPGTVGALALSGEAGSKVLVFSELPLRERVAHRGPFVMNTAAELDQAMEDYRTGRLAPFPPTP